MAGKCLLIHPFPQAYGTGLAKGEKHRHCLGARVRGSSGGGASRHDGTREWPDAEGPQANRGTPKNSSEKQKAVTRNFPASGFPRFLILILISPV